MSEQAPEVTPSEPVAGTPVSTTDPTGVSVATNPDTGVVNLGEVGAAAADVEKDAQTVESDVAAGEQEVKDDVAADAPEVEADVDEDKKNWNLAKGIVQGLGHEAKDAERILLQLWNSGLKVVKHDAPAKTASDVFPAAVPPVS